MGKDVKGRADHGDGTPDEYQVVSPSGQQIASVAEDGVVQLAGNLPVRQPSWRPTAKVLAGWVTGAGSTLVLGLLAATTDAIPADAVWGSLAAAVLTGAASWVKKNRVADQA